MDESAAAMITAATGPRKKPVNRLAEINFVGMNPDPFGPQPTGDISAQRAESHWTTINQIAAQTPNVVADAPELYHGDTEAKPRPDPRASNISAVAAIAKAPGNDCRPRHRRDCAFDKHSSAPHNGLTHGLHRRFHRWVSAIAAAEG